MKKTWKVLIIAVLTMGLLAGCSGNESQQTDSESLNWPNAPVEAVCTFSAGGDTDFNARTFAHYFEEITGKPMVVTNMTGASGSIATQNVKDSKADGLKILFGHTGPLIVNEISGLVDYGFDDFDVAAIPAVDTSNVLVASKQSGITSYEDLVKVAKESPNKIIYGTELGNFSHLQALILQEKAGIELKLADTGSASEKVTNLLGGRIDIAAIAYGSVQDYIKTGDMVAIAQFGAERNELLGDIPTFNEKGLDMAMDKPYIIAFPKGADPEIIQKMSDIAVEISKNPEYGSKLKEGFKQEILVYETEEAKEYLNTIKAEYMKYKDELKMN